MTRKLSDNILDIMNRKVRSATLRDLKRRGMSRVSLLDLSDLDAMIREAVDRTLKEMGIHLKPRELRIQGDRVREEFFRIARDRERLEKSNADLEKQLADLKRNFELGAAKVAADKALLERERRRPVEMKTVPIPPERIESLKSLLSKRLGELLREVPSGPALAKKAVVAVMELIEEERRRAFEEARAAQEERVLTLKRRIGKLMSKLEETESILASIGSGDLPPEGIPSIYKSVQGLKKEAAFYEEKKAALEKMFKLNLELKKLIDEA